MTVNFECKKCKQEFDRDVGKISLSDDRMRPVFEKDIVFRRGSRMTRKEKVL